MSKKAFHHGDLRNSLIELALTEIERLGYEQLSLRELAKSLGVSRAAPYRHFESKEVLLKNLAGIGLDQLVIIYRRVAEAESDPILRLREVCRSYLDFATEKPELYRLIFNGDLDWRDVSESDDVTSNQQINNLVESPDSFVFFEELVAEALGTNDKSKVRKAAMVIWSMIHGCAKLKMDGMLSVFTDPDEFEMVLVKVASNVKAFAI
jgi:AcrR family transcriptional regulator